MARSSKKSKLAQPDIDLDLTPMIDIIFLLIIFFILAGKISSEITNEKITVPPTKTSEKKPTDSEWSRIKIEVYGNTQEVTKGNTRVFHEIRLGMLKWQGIGFKDDKAFVAYKEMRAALDQVYDRAEKYTDPKTKTLQLPKVIVELRADGDCEYRIVQEIQQLLSDTITADDGEGGHMVPHPPKRSFVNIEFTTRGPTDKTQ